MPASYNTHLPPGSAGDPPPYSAQHNTEQNSEVVTILLLGLTQSGKSTFVNWLRSISQTQSDEVLEGDGNSSCTKTCGIREMRIQLTDYKLVDHSPVPKDIQLPNKEGDLLREKGKWTNANSRLIPTTPNAPVVTFRVTDTPGLDDGDQDDSKNITEVLGTLNKWLYETDNPTVNGIVFLINSKSSFSSTFQELFKYYEKCMPDLFGGLLMLNTNFDIKEWKRKRQDLEDTGDIEDFESARTRIIQERRSDFAGCIGRNPPHWYLDSKPSSDDNLQVLLSLNSTIDLLRLVVSQEPSKISHMNYVKMVGDISVDAKIKGLVENKMLTWQKFLELIMCKSSAEKKLYISNQERLLELKQRISNLEADLLKVDHDQTVTINLDHTDLSDDVGFWTRAGRMMTWGGVTKTKVVMEEKYKFYNVEFLDNDKARWEKREKDPQNNSWVGTYKASRGYFPILYTRSYTRSSVYYLDNIKLWREQKVKAETSLDLVENNLSSNEVPEEVDEELERLLLMISQCRDVIAKLELEKIPIETLNEAALRRYKKNPLNVNEYDVIDAVRTYHHSLADSWNYF